MPIYEYLCQSCGQHTEVLQKVSDEPLTVCQACGESGLKKMISSTSFRLKGGGWYETDFKAGKAPSSESSASASGTSDKKTSTTETVAPKSTASDAKDS